MGVKAITVGGLPGLAAVLERTPAVPPVDCDQGAEAAAVALRVGVARVLAGDAVDVGQIRIRIDFSDVADDAYVVVPAALCSRMPGSVQRTTSPPLADTAGLRGVSCIHEYASSAGLSSQ